MSGKKGNCPSWMKHSSSRADSPSNDLAEEENNASCENQRLVQEVRELISEARNIKVPYPIARIVGERIHVSTGDSNYWKMFASDLGFDNKYLHDRHDYWAPKEKQYPLTKLLLEDFTQSQRYLGDLIETLISKELYALLEEIKQQVIDCIQNPHDYESPSENLQSHTQDAVPVREININITGTVSDGLRVSIRPTRNGASSAHSNDCSCSQSESTADTESSNTSSAASSSCNITDDNLNCKDGIVKLGNVETSVRVPNKETLTYQTFSCSPEYNAKEKCGPSLFYPKPSLENFAAMNSFNGNIPNNSTAYVSNITSSSTSNSPPPDLLTLQELFSNLSFTPSASSGTESTASSTQYPSSFTSASTRIGASPEVLSLQELFVRLSTTLSGSSATESITSTSSVPSSPSTMAVGTLPNTVTTANGPVYIRNIFVFITHTVADTELANKVARKLREDYKVIAVTQSQMFHWLCINHEDMVSTILNEVHFVMPLVTERYLTEIRPDFSEDCSNQQLTVRNIFTALQADFFNNSSLNWKIRPVVGKGTSLHETRKKQELRAALQLWQEWDLVGVMMEQALPQHWQSRRG